MRWALDVCPDSLGWQAWLVLCAVVVVLWAVAIIGALTLFSASGRPRGSEQREALEELVRSGQD